MDDESSKKPQQKLYKPGSGPLRRSTSGLDNTMEACTLESNQTNSRGRGRGYGRSRAKHYYNDRFSDINENVQRKNDSIDNSTREKKHAQHLYSSRSPRRQFAKQHYNNYDQKNDRTYNSHNQSLTRNSESLSENFENRASQNQRQFSVPRNTSPVGSKHENNSHNRNRHRDTKSMEPLVYKNRGGKPPSGRRNSSGFSENKPSIYIPQNINELPPRFQKKYLEMGQLSLDSRVNSTSREMPENQNNIHSTPSAWSQTLPTRGRGRLQDPNFDHEKFIANYNRNLDSSNSSPFGSTNILNDTKVDYENGCNDKQWRKNVYTKNVGSDVPRQFSQKNDHHSNNTSEGRCQIKPFSSSQFAQCDVKLNEMEMNEKESDSVALNSLDWTEEVERSIKLENLTLNSTTSTESKQVPEVEPLSHTTVHEDKTHPSSHRPSRRNRRDKRSISQNKVEAIVEVMRPPVTQTAERRNSAQDPPWRQRERNDSHRSSNYDSHEDIDRWRSWRSYSREPSNERKMVSQVNSRDTSSNRPETPKIDGAFKVPDTRTGNKKSRKNRSRGSSRGSRTSHSPVSNTNWREESVHNDKNNRKSANHKSGPPPGVLVLRPERSNEKTDDNTTVQKSLFNPQNPSKPILVQASTGPARHTSTSAKCNHGETHSAEAALIAAKTTSALLRDWSSLQVHRKTLQNALTRLLATDMKYCQSENIEHRYWKVLYYNFIESLRASLTTPDCENRERIQQILLDLFEEGAHFFEDLVDLLEKTYKLKVEDYLNRTGTVSKSSKLALVSIQKLYLFLGDLARYKEQVKETNNFGKSKFWYTKAQQLYPKNGKPYNQLAILSVYAKRKLDAVYYYMRSFMSSNAFHSARESLISLFDENRKKYEAADRKRRATLNASRSVSGGAFRREVWLRPGGSRTTSLHHADFHNGHLEDDERLQSMSSVELNKAFITSYLHVHGKLFTKIGMETFMESTTLMLRQFRALLRQQPLPTTSNRLLQLTALNMFEVEMCSYQKDSELEDSNEKVPSERLDRALSVALLMFGIMLERACVLLGENQGSQGHADAMLLLPAIKIWCDWMLCHSGVWNPPPPLNGFDIGENSDPWDGLARLMNILEKNDDKTVEFSSEPIAGYESVRLEEDIAMAGFTPLMYMDIEPAFAKPGTDREIALRIRRLLFFGSEYLCGTEPPVLRLVCGPNAPPVLVSAVRPRKQPQPPDQLQYVSEDDETEERNSDIQEESGPESEAVKSLEASDEATRRLLRRRLQLQQRRELMEKRKQKMEEIMRSGSVSVEMEIRPKWLVPDTNCFIDHLNLLQRAAAAEPYTLAVPTVVVSELEGLRRCERVGPSARAALEWLMSSSNPSVRFATTRGNLLAKSSFSAEARDEFSSNDDRVLSTAISLQTAQANKAAQEELAIEGTRRLLRAVVLLTDDRNLRVKALAADLPARDLPAFCSWAALH